MRRHLFVRHRLEPGWMGEAIIRIRPVMEVGANTDWVSDVCVKLGKALGCEFRFSPCQEENELHLVKADEADSIIPASHVIWKTPIYDGPSLTGELEIRQPREDLQDPTLPSRNQDAAAVFAEILQRLTITERRLQSLEDSPLLEELTDCDDVVETPPQLVDRMLVAATKATRCRGAAFFLATPSQPMLHLRRALTIKWESIPQPIRPLRASPDQRAIQAGEWTLSRESDRDIPWLPAEARGALLVPVRTTEGCLGTLWCFDRRHREWTSTERRSLKMVAAHLAMGLERSVLLRESDARRRMSHELSFASEHHPSHAMGNVPREAGLDVAIRVASAAALGGDLCEVWPIGKGQTFVAMGDATGHSVPAALIMSVARGSLRTQLHTQPSDLRHTDIVTARLNQALYSVTRGEQFMSLVCAVYDKPRGCLTYTNAGHLPPWHLRNGQATTSATHGMLLGVLPEVNYGRTQLRLQPGDWMIYYTDGISEAMSRQNELFRPTGILGALHQEQARTADEAADVIWTAVDRHRGGLTAKDDQSLMVLRVTG